MLKPSSTIALAVLLSAIVSPAGAATIERQEALMSTDVCQPSAPAYNALFRKRPMKMVNEGTTNGYLTCGFRGIFNAVPSQKALRIGFSNDSDVAKTVKCTLFDGRAALLNAVGFTKSVAALPGATTYIEWTTADNGGNEFIYPAASCLIAPQVGINITVHVFDEEIGS